MHGREHHYQPLNLDFSWRKAGKLSAEIRLIKLADLIPLHELPAKPPE